MAWWKDNREPVVIPGPVLPEAAWLIASRLGTRSEVVFLRALVAGELEVESLEPEDLRRATDLVETYEDFPLDFVDASIVAIAERLGVTTVLTTDRRHFGVVRPSHCERLRLVP